MKWRVFCLFVSPLVCLSGCAGTETGNPSFDGTMGYDAYTSAPTQVALRATPSADSEQAPIQVDSAWLVLGNVSFLGDDECDGHGELGHAKALGAGDHVGSQASATPFELTPAKLCGVRVPIQADAKLPAAAPAELAAHSMLITGTRDGVRFRVAMAGNTDVLLQSSGQDIELDAEHSGLLIGFDVAAWLGDLDWSSASADETGTLVIDETHNAAQSQTFRARVALGIALFRDRDRDGLLDRDSTPLARASQ